MIISSNQLVAFIRWWYTYTNATNLKDLSDEEIISQYNRFRIFTDLVR